MKPTRLLIALVTASLLSACTQQAAPSATNSGQTMSDAVASSGMQPTQNVTYEGTLEPAGITIYMEGTHKLLLDGGRFIMLESNTVNLDQFNGKTVQVLGAVRPTQEAGGIIMDVQTVTDLTPSSSSESSSSVSAAQSTSESQGETSSLSSAAIVSSSVSSIAKESSSAVSISQSASSAAAASSAYQASTQLSDEAATMAKDDMSPQNWTQQYCSGTAGFCVPIHKNWYYRGFGATATTLWHVEVGPTDVNNIGDGPLIVNMLSGTVSDADASDGQVKVTDGSVTGYRSWSESRHIEISAPADLQSAVSFMTTNLKMTGGQ